MIKISQDTQQQFLECYRTTGIMLEGNFLKIIDLTNVDIEFKTYIEESIKTDKQKRVERLKLTKDIQSKNKELTKSEEINEKIKKELQETLIKAEKAKETALSDLDLLQKKTQFELIGFIVKISLWIICSVGVLTTVLFLFCLLLGIDNKIIESVWSNMFSILLTNSFSIIGTIMGVKYASERSNKENN
jgi:hypothetical protein